MPHSHTPRVSRRVAVLALTLFASLLSCGREITGPGGRGAMAQLAFAPNYSSMIDEVDGVAHSVADLVPFNRVRIELRRVDNTIAAAEVVDFPEDATEVPLSVTVRLGDAATSEGELFTAFLRYINAAGDTVFAGGPLSVLASPRGSQSQEPIDIPIVPTVPGAVFARVEISPDTVIATMGQNANFTAVGFDGQDVVVPNAIIGFISRNPGLVSVPNLGSGTVFLNGVRGSTWLIAQSLTGLRDSAFIQVLPRPSAIDKLGGDGQTALTSSEFAQPLRIRLRAADNLPVANWPVTFNVTSGGGLLSATNLVTDANGEAQVNWTAGEFPGPATVTVTSSGPDLIAVFTGTQASTLPSSLAFQTQPIAITAGDQLPNIDVEVRNGLGEVITDFTGTVSLGLTGGSAGAQLLGGTSVNAVNGIATFSELTVDQGGTGYRLVANLAPLPPVQSNAFNVAAAPPSSIIILGGNGQSAPPLTLLADSIRVRVLNAFEAPVAGATVNFTVTAGAGIVSSASRVTDADGRAAVTWTLGAAGAQSLSIGVGQINTSVNATAIVGGGSAELFAGFDYTFVPLGQAKTVPVYLSEPVGSATTVTLTMQNPAIAQWSTSSIEIGSGATQAQAIINGLGVGSSWAYLSSALGTDSLLVTVDSASLLLSQLYYDSWTPGDTVYSIVRISEPAPPGGVSVLLRSSDSLTVLVAPGTGEGAPSPGCLDIPSCNNVDLRMDAVLLSGAADTAVIVIPAGQVVGQIAYIARGVGAASVQATAPGHRSANFGIFVDSGDIFLSWDDISPEFGMAPGQIAPTDVYFNRPSYSKPRRLSMFVRNPAIAIVDSVAIAAAGNSYSAPVTVHALTQGSTYLVWTAPGFITDSMPINVTSGKFTINSSDTFVAETGTGEIAVAVGSTLSNLVVRQAVDRPFTIRVEPAGIIELDRSSGSILAGELQSNVTFAAVGPGSASVIVEGPGVAADTLAINTYQDFLNVNYFTSNVGVGLETNMTVSLSFSQLNAGSRVVSVVSSNPEFAEVLTPTLHITSNNTAVARIAGRSNGVTELSFSSPGYQTTTLMFDVVDTDLSLNVATGFDPESFDRPAGSNLVASGFAFAPIDTTRAVLRSTDPSIVRVTDSLITWTPGFISPLGGRYQLMAPGTASLWLVQPGVDSVAASVTVNPYRLIALGPPSVGIGMGDAFSLWRTGPDNIVAPITVTHQGPGLVSIPDMPSSFVSGAQVYATMVGETFGLDTVIFSILDHAPDTVIVDVQSTRVEIVHEDEVSVGMVDEFVTSNFRRVGGSSFYTPGRVTSLRLRSSDTTRAVVTQESLVFQPGNTSPAEYAVVSYRGVGPVLLILDDLGGELVSDTLEVYVAPRSIMGSSYYSDVSVVMGQRQRTEPYELYIDRGFVSPEPLTVYLTSTAPSLVEVPSSVVIQPFTRFAEVSLSSGLDIGSARIVASAPGYNPWEIDVLVTRGRIATYTNGGAVGGRAYHESYVMDAIVGFVRRSRDAIPARMLSSNLAVADTVGGSFTFPADSAYFEHAGLLGVSAGNYELEIEDTRSASPQRLVSSSELTVVARAKLSLDAERFTATPGTRSTGPTQRVFLPVTRDSVWLHFATRNGSASTVDSILVQRSQTGSDLGVPDWFEEFPLFGGSNGVDTLIVSADGYESDTALVYVQQGVISYTAASFPTIVTGDSVQVTFSTRSPDGVMASARLTPINLNFSTGAGIAVRDGGIPVSTVPIDVGDASVTVWIHGLSAGSHSLSVSASNFKTTELRFNVVTRP